jgi:hypothetical protein
VRPSGQEGQKKKTGSRWLFLLAALKPGVFLLEFLDAAGGVDEFLLAGKEGVTGGADFDVHFAVHRAELDLVATGADCLDLTVFPLLGSKNRI